MDGSGEYNRAICGSMFKKIIKYVILMFYNLFLARRRIGYFVSKITREYLRSIEQLRYKKYSNS